VEPCRLAQGNLSVSQQTGIPIANVFVTQGVRRFVAFRPHRRARDDRTGAAAVRVLDGQGLGGSVAVERHPLSRDSSVGAGVVATSGPMTRSLFQEREGT